MYKACPLLLGNVQTCERDDIEKARYCKNVRETIIEHEYSNLSDEENLWELFDFDVVDEFHSLETDVTFAERSYYVR